MADRRALIIAPLYDGKWLAPLAGRAALVDRLRECLSTAGEYDVKDLSGVVTNAALRETAAGFFDSPGELLLYFYGHGCIGDCGLGFFAKSDARLHDEGVGMHEIAAMAGRSPASEIVLILDCCHAGAIKPVTAPVLDTLKHYFNPEHPFGRDILAACAEHQQGWEARTGDETMLGAFSSVVLRGLEGEARYGTSNVRGTLLAAYVTGTFGRWGQEPVTITNETGMRHCVITRGFSEDSERKPKDKEPMLLGIPFKPSQIFVGRQAEIDQLKALLVDGLKPVAVSATVEGLGGIGKTELVLQLMHDPGIRDAYNTIVWLDGSGPLPPQWEAVAGQLGIKLPKSRPADLIERIERGLEHRGNTLIVLDNADTWGASRQWIPGEIPLLVTTRTQDFGGNQFTHIPLGILSDESAKRFLLQMVPDLEQDPSLGHLLSELGGHALALELAGWNIKSLGISCRDYLDRLDRHDSDTRYALANTRYARTTEACLQITWESLQSDASRSLWRHAALFAPVSAHRDLLRISYDGSRMMREEAEEMLHYMARRGGIDDEEMTSAFLNPGPFEDAYAELRAFHVLSRVEGHNGERWAMHRVVRDFGRARLKNYDTMLHALALSEWLRKPTLPLALEVPHFIVAILDSARNQGMMAGDRYLAREMAHRSPMLFDRFDSGYFIRYIRDELRDPRALSLILEGLTDVNQDVRVQAIRLLEQIGPIPEMLTALETSLNDPDPTVRARASQTLAEHGGDETVRILKEAIRGTNPRARLAGVRALALMREKGREGLRETLHSNDPKVCLEAALALCEQGESDGVDVLAAALGNTSGDQRNQIIGALGNSHAPTAVPHISALLERPTDRIKAIHALGQIGEARAHELIRPFLRDELDAVRLAAAEAISSTASKGHCQEVVNALLSPPYTTSPGRSVDFAVQLASKQGIPLPADSWRGLLHSHDWNTRMACAISLGKSRTHEAVEELITALGDSDNDVRREVAKALGLIGDTSAITALRQTAEKDRHDDVKKAAKHSLNQLGQGK